MKKSYVFARKTRAELDLILEGKEVVLRNDDTVHVLRSYNQFDMVQMKDLRAYQTEKTEQKKLKLSFCKEINEKTMINFIPFIYQE